MLQKRFRESLTQEISEKGVAKKKRWCQCLPRWRRHCAKSVTPMPAKPRQLLRYHIVVLKPLSWRAGEVFIDALCSFRCIFYTLRALPQVSTTPMGLPPHRPRPIGRSLLLYLRLDEYPDCTHFVERTFTSRFPFLKFSTSTCSS